jgi:uncharacterized protein (DUF2141 family)
MPRPFQPISIPSFFVRLSAVSTLLVATTMGAASDAAGNAITVSVTGLRNDQGQVACTLYTSADGFPSKPEKAAARQFVKIAAKSSSCFFDNLAPGTYAVAVMHDENGNGKLDKNFIGMPTEGFGASRDARGTMGPPKWDDASFSFPGGSVQIPVTIHY